MRKSPFRFRVELEGLGHLDYDPSATVEMGGHQVPAELHVVFPGDRHGPSLDMTLAVDESGVPSCRDLRITAKGGGRGIRDGDLRGVRLEDWIEDLFAVASMRVDEDAGVRHLSVHDVEGAAKAVRAARRGARRKISDALLAEVAETYRANVKKAPTQAVADRFAVSHRGASWYVRRARDQGLLPPTSQGRRDA